MRVVAVFFALVVGLVLLTEPKAANESPKAQMTEAAFNIKAWQAYQKTAVARASAVPTPTKVPTVV